MFGLRPFSRLSWRRRFLLLLLPIALLIILVVVLLPPMVARLVADRATASATSGGTLSQLSTTSTAPSPPTPLPWPSGEIGPGCIIQSHLGNSHNLEVVVLQGTSLIHYWHDDSSPTYAWHRGQVITDHATGPGCITESTLGPAHDNFEVVVPQADSQGGQELVHYFHNNADLTSPWQQGQVIAHGIMGPGCIIQSTLGPAHDNFEVVVPQADSQGSQELVYYFHNNADFTSPWQQGQVIAHEITGPGCIIQSTLGPAQNDFEVVVPQRGEGGQELVHYFHNNTDVHLPWQRGQMIAHGITGPGCIIQSTLGPAQNDFEVAVPQTDPQGGQELVHYFHNNTDVHLPWQQGQVIAHGITGPGCITESTFGADHNNFEVVVPQGGALVHYFHDNSDVNQPWEQGQTITFSGRSQKICQLTGQQDREYEQPTTNQTMTTANIQGTDLGFPVEADPVNQNGKLYFLFGDTGAFSASAPGQYDGGTGQDSVAFTQDETAPTLNACIHLQFNVTATDSGVTFAPPVVQPAINQGFFDVPTSGFSANGHLYVFFWTHSDPNCGKAVCCPESHLLGCVTPSDWGSSVLARSDDGGRTFTQVYTVPGSNFVYTAPVVAQDPDTPDLPAGPGIFVWGVSQYRNSSPHLAYIPLSGIENAQSWRYFNGPPSSDQPQWSAQDQSVNLFDQPCVGEFSVAWNRFLQQWLMLYNCGPQGQAAQILARVANHPWGPWSAPAVLFDQSDGSGASNDNGLCHFVHLDDPAHPNAPCDQAGDPTDVNGWPSANQPDHSGAVYAPYILTRYTSGNDTSTTIYFTLSTWNPYEVVIMRCTLALPGA